MIYKDNFFYGGAGLGYYNITDSHAMVLSMNRHRVHPDQQNLQRKIAKQSGMTIFYS